VTDLDLVVSFAGIFLVNVIILTCWTTISPLQWERERTLTADQLGPLITTYAWCDGDDQVVYWTLLAAFNLGVLVVCNWWAYRSRNIETEFNESSYVGVSAAAVLQAWAMGIPIIIVVVADSPQAAFYVTTGIVFVTSQALISLIYIPKVIALRKARKEELEKEKLESFRAHKNSGSRGGDENDLDDGEPVRDETVVRSVASAPAWFVGTESTQCLSSEEVTQAVSRDCLSGGNASQGSPDYPPTLDAAITSRRVDPQVAKSDSHVNGGKADASRSGMSHTMSWSPGVFERKQQRPLPPPQAGSPDASPSELQMSDSEENSSFRPTRLRPQQSGKSISLSSWRRLSVFSGGSGSSSSQALGGSASGSGAFGTAGGTKVLHNPRSKRALEASDGHEMSRRQLELYIQRDLDANDNDDDNDINDVTMQLATIASGHLGHGNEDNPSHVETGMTAQTTGAINDSNAGAAQRSPPVMEFVDDDDDDEESDSADMTRDSGNNNDPDRSNGHKSGDMVA
jgi:hypothetical protein